MKPPRPPATARLNKPATVAAGFVTGLLAGVPGNAAALLERAGIAKAVLSADAAASAANSAPDSTQDCVPRIAVARYAALYRLVSDSLDDEGFGLFARPLRRGHFEFLCRATLSAATLEEALERIAGFFRLTLDELQIELHIELRADAAGARLSIREARTLPVGPAGRVFAFEWLLRLVHGLAAWLVAHPLPLDEVAFPYPPPLHAADYELVFAPRSRFHAAQLEARFPAAWLALPVRRDEAALQAFLVGAPASITTLYRRDRALALRVRERLRAALPEHPTLADIARRLFLSPRTLHRRLEEEGTQFRAIKENLRRDLAIEWLSTTNRPLQQIGADLGFADAATFYRAFVGWTGSAPRDYRRRERQT